MNKLISFCINTTRFELEYLKLLIYSLQVNLDNKNHEIIVFVENDTEAKDVQKFLLTQKSIFPNLKIIINRLPICVGYANNINIMFSLANNDIVSYLQSDMCIAPHYDTEVLRSLEKLGERTILSATRIEPNLHQTSPEKITKDFGLFPLEISQNFNRFCEFATQQINHNKITDFFFAPFTLHKTLWLSIGGHDTLFRRSREDSDILYRMAMSGYNIKQCWNAFVYHRSCVSSRGPEWWTERGKARAALQAQADMIEQIRFVRKWGDFKHNTKFNNADFKYDIGLNIFNNVPSQTDFVHDILTYYPFQTQFKKFHFKDEAVDKKLRVLWSSYHNPANRLLNISDEEWNQYKKYYRTWEYDDIFLSSPIKDTDIIVDFDLSVPNLDPTVIKDISHMINAYNIQNVELGSYEISNGINITFNQLKNRIKENIIVKNPPIDDINFTIL